MLLCTAQVCSKLSLCASSQEHRVPDSSVTTSAWVPAALKFLKKAIRRHGVPETITIDGSAANEAAIKRYNEEHGTAITIRKRTYLNNVVECRLSNNFSRLTYKFSRVFEPLKAENRPV